MALKGHDSVKLMSSKAGKLEIEVLLPALKQGTQRDRVVSVLQFTEEL